MGSSKWNCISAFKLKSVSVAGRMETERKKQSPKRRQVVNTHVGAINSLKLPDGLIGMRCTAQVRVEGKEVNCLLNTGSHDYPLVLLQQSPFAPSYTVIESPVGI